VFLLVLLTMPKRLRYFASSLLGSLIFFMLISLPFEARYYGLMAGVVLLVFIYWFGLGIIFEESLFNKIVPVTLPVAFFVGFGLFMAIFPYNLLTAIPASIFFGLICYVIFSIENIFFVAIGYKTVPLYRAAYTFSLMVMLLTAFFAYDTILSFRTYFWVNAIAVFLTSMLLFLYQFWAIAIELPDDGKNKSISAYVIVPSIVMAELALIFSFWPVGIFKGSVYLVSVFYIILGLLQADIRERLFKRTWTGLLWVALAVLIGVVGMTSWGE